MENIIPKDERSKSLKVSIIKIFDMLRAIITGRQLIIRIFDYPQPLTMLLNAWYSNDEKIITDSKTAGINGTEIIQILENILKEDSHLKGCCRDWIGLSRLIDNYFFNKLYAYLFFGKNITSEDTIFQENYNNFEKIVYETGRYKLLFFAHLFNFQSSLNEIKVNNLKIVKLEEQSIARLIGEYTTYSFLHSGEIGNHFLVFETDNAVIDNHKWMQEQWKQAGDIEVVMQLYKDGFFCIDYASIYFLPYWVNDLMRKRLFFWGEIRKENKVSKVTPYNFEQKDIAQLCKWIDISNYLEKIGFNSSSDGIRQVIRIAGDFFSASFTRSTTRDILINLIISLEALFSPINKEELRYRISNNCALLLGDNDSDRKSIFELVKEMYKKRNTIVHGSVSFEKSRDDNFLQIEELRKLIGIVRLSILYFITAYIEGYRDRKDLLQKIENSLFDTENLKTLRRELDLSNAISELEKKISAESQKETENSSS